MNTGPSGFYNAPITKAILLSSGAISVLATVLNIKTVLNFPHDLSTLGQIWRPLTSHFPFSSPGELLFGSILIYQFRVFERLMGTRKFAVFVSLTMTIYTLIQTGVYSLSAGRIPSYPAGPYSFIFACFVLFFFEIPSTYRFRILGIPANDKFFTYAIGSQLLLVNTPGSLLSGITGILSALIYRSDTLQLSKWRFPSFIERFCSRFVLPFFQSTRAPQRNPVAISGNVHSSGSSSSRRARRDVHGENQFPNNQWANVQNVPPSAEAIATLTAMGFTEEQVVAALQQAHNNLEVATNILLDSLNHY